MLLPSVRLDVPWEIGERSVIVTLLRFGALRMLGDRKVVLPSLLLQLFAVWHYMLGRTKRKAIKRLRQDQSSLATPIVILI